MLTCLQIDTGSLDFSLGLGQALLAGAPLGLGRFQPALGSLKLLLGDHAIGA
jgi:hypothetical protein